MSTLNPKPVKAKKLPNPKLLPIAALVLVVLALLFMATPLLRTSRGFQQGGNFGLRGNGPVLPQNGTSGQGTGPRFIFGGGGGTAGQNGTTVPARRFAFGSGILGGFAGAIFYFVLLLVSLAAAVGMYMTKRWGQVLGIIMGVLYGLLGLVSLLPLLLVSFLGIGNPLSLILGIVHLVLAVAVVVLASIPAKKLTAPAVAIFPPEVTG